MTDKKAANGFKEKIEAVKNNILEQLLSLENNYPHLFIERNFEHMPQMIRFLQVFTYSKQFLGADLDSAKRKLH